MTSFIGDIRDAEGLKAAMKSAAPDIAFHFAAQPLVRASYGDPAHTYSVNVMGTVNFLEAVRQTPSIRAAVIVTSDKCYENKELLSGFRESDRMGGSDPYSSSKGCAELVVTAYRRSFFTDDRVRLASVRAGNVIGGGDWASDRLIPDIVRSFSSGQPLRVRYPHAVRPWQHVLEPLRGYLMLAERLWDGGTQYAGGWNFGPRDEDAWPVLDVVRHCALLWGNSASWTSDTRPKPHEACYLKLNSSKAKSRLGWTQMLDLKTGLDWTISWYRYSVEGDVDLRSFTEAQISRYDQIAAFATSGPALQLVPAGNLSLAGGEILTPVRFAMFGGKE
jgi:CDP-glucose 4,6-dehydratase